MNDTNSLNDVEFCNSDMNGNGSINVTDLIMIIELILYDVNN